MFDPRWGDDPRDRGDDVRDRNKRDRNDDDTALGLRRGPSSQGGKADSEQRDRDNERRPARERDSGGRDPRDVFMRDLELPRGRERETVYDVRERGYRLRGSETRSLSTVGAFRVVAARDLRDRAAGRRIRVAATCDICASKDSSIRFGRMVGVTLRRSSPIAVETCSGSTATVPPMAVRSSTPATAVTADRFRRVARPSV